MKEKLCYLSIRLFVASLFVLISLSNTTSMTNARAVGSATASSFLTAPLQDSGPIGPLGMPLTEIEAVIMPVVDVQKLLNEDVNGLMDKPPRFATSLNVQISPATHGTWETLADGTQLWRLHITSVDALSLSFGFTAYDMPPSGQLYIYTPDYSQVIGPFTNSDNEEHGQLWTPLLMFEEAIIEVSLPELAVSQLTLELTSVNHGYVDFFDATEKSGSCNVDVMCSEGDAWRNEIRSVGHYLFTESGSSYVCTGTLINNTSQNRVPYFLTANHCISDSTVAATVVVYWNYENATCRAVDSTASGTPISRSSFPNQSGAFLRATYATSDFTLLELDDAVAASVNANWSGWDRSGNNAISAVGIHHPQGHEKRISLENSATTITSYLGASVPGDSSHIRIEDWDAGTTEGGSSGSALFDQNHRIIGQLHGGYAACGNNSSDWYGRLSISWTGGGTNTSRLSNWLDPTTSGITTLNGLENGLVNTNVVADFNGDGRSDVSIFRPSTGKWYVNGYSPIYGLAFGASGDIPVSGDYNGDGKTDVAIFRPSTGKWYVNGYSPIYGLAFGSPGDIPVPGDYDGDGKTDVAIFRPSTGKWYVNGVSVLYGFAFGASGDIPVPADYTGDGKTDVAIFRPSTGKWYVNGYSAVYGYAFGASGDIPVPADYTGDGRADVAFFRPSTGKWYVNGYSAVYGYAFGASEDIPVPADYTGDGRTDVAIFRPSTGKWYVNGYNAIYGYGFGQTGDYPIPSRWTGEATTAPLYFVLTWGASPTDLDSHLWLPTATPFHVYFGNRGSQTVFPFASLDRDDITSYGPETTGILRYYAGTYKYAVYQYSSSGTLSTSGAQVKVYRNGALIQTYNVPGGTGRWWYVLDVNGSTGGITPRNYLMSSQPGAYSAMQNGMDEVWPEK